MSEKLKNQNKELAKRCHELEFDNNKYYNKNTRNRNEINELKEKLKKFNNIVCSRKCAQLMERQDHHILSLTQFIAYRLPSEIYKLNLFKERFQEEISSGTSICNIPTLKDFIEQFDNQHKNQLLNPVINTRNTY